jgi:hypothetical protein
MFLFFLSFFGGGGSANIAMAAVQTIVNGSHAARQARR